MNWIPNKADFDSACAPIKSILTRSVFYPASGIDGKPVQFLGNRYQSFVYVDYGVTRENVRNALTDTRLGFRGYDVACLRDLTEAKLVPDGWRPSITPDESERTKRPPEGRIQPPFAAWALMTRQAQFGSEHGPDCFSILYVGGDGVATFQALYHGNRIAPEVVCVIQPGTGFGGNWTDFCDRKAIFARSVMENPAGTPRFLLYGGWGPRDGYSETCWPEYGNMIEEFRLKNEGGLFLFERSEQA